MRLVLALLLVLGLCTPVMASIPSRYRYMSVGSADVTQPSSASKKQLAATSTPTDLLMLKAVYKTANGVPSASHDNRGLYIGGSTVSAGGTEGSGAKVYQRQGLVVLSTEFLKLEGVDLQDLYIDSVNTHDGVTYIYWQY